MPEITNDELGYHIKPPAGKMLDLNGVNIAHYQQTVDHADFTDGGAAVGTLDLSTVIPLGAFFLGCALRNVTGFAGDTSAVIVVGDGSDADRYMTGTPNVFASIPGGLSLGIPNGVLYHAAAKTPKVTITTAADWTSVSAGGFIIDLYWLEPIATKA